MVECPGPHAKLLHVVAHGSHLVGVGVRGLLQIVDHLLDSSERNQIPKNFLAGDQPNGLPMVFRDVVRKKLLWLESGRQKVDIVENGVANIGFREDGSELRLPNALRKPSPGGTLAKMVLQIVGKTNDLYALVRGWDRDENRLVEAAGHHLHLPSLHQAFQTLEIFGAILFNPG